MLDTGLLFFDKIDKQSRSATVRLITLALGNEPAYRIDFQPSGYLKPKATFIVFVPKEAAPTGKVTLVAMQQCNLHGYWEGTLDIAVT